MFKNVSIITVFFLLLINVSCKQNANELNNENSNYVFQNDEIKDIDNVSDYLSSYHVPTKGPILPKIWAWILAHNGTNMFNNCNGNGACGPCSGMCLYLSPNSQVVGEDYVRTEQDKSDGKSLVSVVKIEDGLNKIIISFDVTSDFVMDDILYIPEDTDLGSEVATEFERSTFILKKGLYPICYTYNNKGETVIDLK